MAKKSKTIRLSETAIKILLALTKKHDRSEGYVIEQLILEEGKKQKINELT